MQLAWATIGVVHARPLAHPADSCWRRRPSSTAEWGIRGLRTSYPRGGPAAWTAWGFLAGAAVGLTWPILLGDEPRRACRSGRVLGAVTVPTSGARYAGWPVARQRLPACREASGTGTKTGACCSTCRLPGSGPTRSQRPRSRHPHPVRFHPACSGQFSPARLAESVGRPPGAPAGGQIGANRSCSQRPSACGPSRPRAGKEAGMTRVLRLVAVAVLLTGTAAAIAPAVMAQSPPRWVLHVGNYPGGISNGVRARVVQASQDARCRGTACSPGRRRRHRWTTCR